jgi:hypothetical protein
MAVAAGPASGGSRSSTGTGSATLGAAGRSPKEGHWLLRAARPRPTWRRKSWGRRTGLWTATSGVASRFLCLRTGFRRPCHSRSGAARSAAAPQQRCHSSGWSPKNSDASNGEQSLEAASESGRGRPHCDGCSNYLGSVMSGTRADPWKEWLGTGGTVSFCSFWGPFDLTL